MKDNYERPFGSLTGQLQSSGFLRLQHASGMAQAPVDGDFNRGNTTLITGKNRFEKKNNNAAMGASYMLPFELHQSLLKLSKKMHQKRERPRIKLFFTNKKQSDARRSLQGKGK